MPGLKFLFLLILSFGTLGCQLEAFLIREAAESSSDPAPDVPLTYLRGVNIIDLASSGTTFPGVYNTDYTKPNLVFLQNLKLRGLNVVRIPFLWERVQPILGGPLDTAYLGYILSVLQDANTAGLKVILDMHNLGGYSSGGLVSRLGSFSGPTSVQYADVWSKISLAIQAVPTAASAVYAYDIMNEPAGMPDTRGSVPDAGAYAVTDFSATADGWSGDGATTGVHSAQAGGSLKLSRASGAASFTILQAIRNSFALSSSNGLTIRIKGQLPTTTEGDSPSIRLSTIVGFTIGPVATKSIDKGNFDVSFTLTAGQWAGVTGLYIELILNNVSGAGPYEFYINEVLQGTGIVGQKPAAVWESFSQAGVDAIRATGDTTSIMVEGYDYASAELWATNHPTKWITDASNKIIYQAHSYWDTDSEGAYANSFATETTNAISEGHASVAARAVSRAKVFTDWVTAQGVKGFMGELGWPNSALAPADFSSWDQVGETVLTHLDSVNMGATLWCSGSWLSATDNSLNSYVQTPFAPLSPSVILEAHPGR